MVNSNLSPERLATLKDLTSIVLSEQSGQPQEEIRAWLENVHTAEDFFGSFKTAQADYNAMISKKERNYEQLQRKQRNTVV